MTPILVLCVSLFSHAGLLYHYKELSLKDVEQMNKIVGIKLQESKKTRYGKNVPLKEALQAVFSRPDHDAVIDKVVGPLRSELERLNAWEKAVKELTQEALNALSNPKAFQPKVQVTYAIFLLNLSDYFGPGLNSDPFARQIVEKIRDNNISLMNSAKEELQLTAMRGAPSPSVHAKELLEQTNHQKETESASGASGRSEK